MLKCKKCGKTSFSTILNNGVCSECYKEFQRQEARQKAQTQRTIQALSSHESQRISPRSVNGYVSLFHIHPEDPTVFRSLSERFIAIDVETTGLNRSADRIIQVAAIVFENTSIVDRYVTLINPQMHIPSVASKINRITDEMVMLAPLEPDVARSLFAFLGTALTGATLFAAHNAEFDMAFLSQMFMRNGLSGQIKFIDTLELSRKYFPGLDNYKQSTIATSLGIEIGNAHRADADAEVCGQIVLQLIPKIDHAIKRTQAAADRRRPSQEELGICAYLFQLLQEDGLSTADLKYAKKSDGAVRVLCGSHEAFQFKVYKSRPTQFFFYDTPVAVSGSELDTQPSEESASAGSECTIENLDDILRLRAAIRSSYASKISLYQTTKKYERHEVEYFFDCFTVNVDEVPLLIEACRDRERAALAAEEEKLRVAEEKRAEKERKAEEARLMKEQAWIEKQNRAHAPVPGRAVCQYDDEMNLINTYISVSAAAKAVGITDKSIRDAANGKQRHAAGYVWRYQDK